MPQEETRQYVRVGGSKSSPSVLLSSDHTTRGWNVHWENNSSYCDSEEKALALAREILGGDIVLVSVLP
ncbi:MAG TPA: hypothetical protein VF794_10625 [Archangium sp.]|uniref:hypothetical protein n=1 Tax=Archangium sp. TaxID=1872627 RepID=UPI002EDB641C